MMKHTNQVTNMNMPNAIDYVYDLEINNEDEANAFLLVMQKAYGVDNADELKAKLLENFDHLFKMAEQYGDLDDMADATEEADEITLVMGKLKKAKEFTLKGTL